MTAVLKTSLTDKLARLTGQDLHVLRLLIVHGPLTRKDMAEKIAGQSSYELRLQMVDSAMRAALETSLVQVDYSTHTYTVNPQWRAEIGELV